MSDKPEIVTKVEDIARHLPAGWHAAGRPKDGYLSHGHDIVGPEGARLFVRVETYGAREGDLHVSGCYERDDRISCPLTKNPSIGIGGARSAEAAAKDIERRLLPAYLPLLKDHREAMRQADETARRTAELLMNLIEGLDVKHGPKDGKAEIGFKGAWDYSDVELSVMISDGAPEVTMKFDRMTEAQALRLAQWMREHLEGAALLR